MMPDWLETMTVVQIVGWLIALGGVVAGLRWLKPIADALHNLVLDWGGEPARDGVPARLGVQKLQRFEVTIGQIHHMDVVAHTRAVRRIVIIAKYA